MNDMHGFLIEDGMLLEYTGSDVNLAIPKGVTHIDSYAFEKFTNLMRITIPDSVVSIGGHAGHLRPCHHLGAEGSRQNHGKCAEYVNSAL